MIKQTPDSELYRNYVLRLRTARDFMAYVLHQYQLQEGLSDEDFLRQLELSSDYFVRLAMCQRPSDQSPHYAQKVRQIARFASVNELLLFRILRQVENLEALQNPGDKSQFFSAARDRESDSQE